MAIGRDRLQCRVSSAAMPGMARCSRIRLASSPVPAASGKVKGLASTPFTLRRMPLRRDPAIAAARRGF
jgi:hypothetical protein